jgi:hypothetical protein
MLIGLGHGGGGRRRRRQQHPSLRGMAVEKVGGRVGDEQLRETIGPVLGRKGGEAIRLRLQRQSIGVGPGPDDIKGQIARRGSAVAAQQIVALFDREDAGARDLARGGFVLRHAVETVGVLETLRGAAKDAAVVPSDELDDALVDFNNGREKGKDLLLGGVIVDFEKGQGGLTGGTDGDDGTLGKDIVGGVPTQDEVVVGYRERCDPSIQPSNCKNKKSILYTITRRRSNVQLGIWKRE